MLSRRNWYETSSEQNLILTFTFNGFLSILANTSKCKWITPGVSLFNVVSRIVIFYSTLCILVGEDVLVVLLVT